MKFKKKWRKEKSTEWLRVCVCVCVWEGDRDAGGGEISEVGRLEKRNEPCTHSEPLLYLHHCIGISTGVRHSTLIPDQNDEYKKHICRIIIFVKRSIKYGTESQISPTTEKRKTGDWMSSKWRVNMLYAKPYIRTLSALIKFCVICSKIDFPNVINKHMFWFR